IARAHAEKLPEAPLGFVYPYLGDFGPYVELLAGLGDPNVELEVRAFTRRLKGEHALASGDFRELAQRTPWVDVLGYESGASLLEAHQNDRAAETFAHVLGTWPNVTIQGLGLTVAVRPRALFGLALAQEQLGQPQQARQSFEKLLKLWTKADPDLPEL